MSKKALKQAIEIVGSQAKLAQICGGNVRQVHVSKWLTRASDKVPPAEHVLKIEKATGVSRFDLRPDVFLEIE